MTELTGQIALVTGATRGIGKASAQALAAAGATVIGTATSAAGAQSIAAGLADLGGYGRVLDVCHAEQSAELVANIVAKHGRLDILVNNAAITRDSLLLRTREADWDAVLSTNLTAVSRLCRMVLRPMMKHRHGRIICLSSVVSAMGNAGQCSYAASKAALGGLARSLAREVASRNITVNLVAPGFIDTDMTRALNDEIRAQLLGQIPQGRLGESSDVAASIVFLASPGAGYITGQTLHVNGGMYMSP